MKPPGGQYFGFSVWHFRPYMVCCPPISSFSPMPPGPSAPGRRTHDGALCTGPLRAQSTLLQCRGAVLLPPLATWHRLPVPCLTASCCHPLTPNLSCFHLPPCKRGASSRQQLCCIFLGFSPATSKRQTQEIFTEGLVDLCVPRPQEHPALGNGGPRLFLFLHSVGLWFPQCLSD